MWRWKANGREQLYMVLSSCTTVSSWTCITFVPGTRDLMAVEADLRDAIQEAEADSCRSSEQDDPNTWTENGSVYWYLHGFAHETTFDGSMSPVSERWRLPSMTRRKRASGTCTSGSTVGSS